MNKQLVLVGGAISKRSALRCAGIFVLGVGVVVAADAWLDHQAKTKIESQLTEATGVNANLEKADVQLLQKKLEIDKLNLANIAGFPSANVLTINHIELSNPDLQKSPVHIATASVEGVQVNVDGNLNSLPNPMMAQGLPKLNLVQLVNHLEKQHNDGSNSTTQTNGTTATNPEVIFTIDQLTIGAINIKINLEVPWQTTAIAHEIQIPEIVLTDVTNLNIGEKIINTLGTSFQQDLQAFFLKEVLPGAVNYVQKSIPKEIDLSKTPIPKGVVLPKNIQLPNIKLP